MVEELRYVLKICIMGADAKLRENFSRTHAEGRFNENYLQTIGVDITTQTIKMENTAVKLIITDTAGDDDFENLRSQFYQGSSGGILTYSQTQLANKKEQVLAKVKKFYQEFRENVPDTRIPVVIVGDTKEPSSTIPDLGINPTIHTRYYQIDSTKREAVSQRWEELAKVVITKKIEKTHQEDLPELHAFLDRIVEKAKKWSIISYWGNQTLGYCAYNCDEISEEFLTNYNKYHKEPFRLFPPNHLPQCLSSCPLFSLLVDKEQVYNLQKYLKTS